MYAHTYIQADLILRISTFLVVIFSKRLLALPTKQGKDIVFRLIIEYSSLRDLGP
jgi:hypothetical protein